MEMEQLNYGEEIPCSSDVENAGCWPDDSITGNAPMLILYPATGNNWSEDKDVVTDGFIVGLFISYTWAITISFTASTVAFMPITDDDMADMCPGNTFCHNNCTLADGSTGTGSTLVLSGGDMAASKEPGNIQSLLVWCGCIRMHYYMWKRQSYNNYSFLLAKKSFVTGKQSEIYLTVLKGS